jgi:hypothetical protein
MFSFGYFEEKMPFLEGLPKMASQKWHLFLIFFLAENPKRSKIAFHILCPDSSCSSRSSSSPATTDATGSIDTDTETSPPKSVGSPSDMGT